MAHWQIVMAQAVVNVLNEGDPDCKISVGDVLDALGSNHLELTSGREAADAYLEHIRDSIQAGEQA